jgi:hypothetical protein
MNRRGILLTILAAFVCFSSSYANITNVTYASDGDGAFTCTPWSWSGSASEVSMDIYGDLHWGPGHMTIDVLADSPGDPTLKLSNSIDNDTSFAWTQFTVNLTMGVGFTLTNVVVTTPGTWSVVSFDQTASYTGSNYLATVVYDSGPAIAINDAIDFGYWVQFSGSPSYTITQEMIPVPEPSTLGLVILGGLFIASRTLRRGRQ